MTLKQCESCDGNGYQYDTGLSEITDICQNCNGEGVVDNSPFVNINSFHVELQVEVAEDAYFSDDVRRRIESQGWSYEDYPVQSEYLLQLLVSFFDKLRGDGIGLKSIAVGKQVVYVNSIDLGGNNNQPTLF